MAIEGMARARVRYKSAVFYMHGLASAMLGLGLGLGLNKSTIFYMALPALC